MKELFAHLVSEGNALLYNEIMKNYPENNNSSRITLSKSGEYCSTWLYDCFTSCGVDAFDMYFSALSEDCVHCSLRGEFMNYIKISEGEWLATALMDEDPIKLRDHLLGITVAYEPEHIEMGIIDMACKVFKSLLTNPKYDALGDSRATNNPTNTSQMDICSSLASAANYTRSEDVDRFCRILKRHLEGEVLPVRFFIDYDPDSVLANLMIEADLKMQMPWKTQVGVEQSMVSCSSGYGSPTTYYSLLSENTWLIHQLSGDIADLNKEPTIIKL